MNVAKFNHWYWVWREHAIGMRNIRHNPNAKRCQDTYRVCIHHARYLRTRGDHRASVAALNEARLWHDLSKGER